MATIAVPDRYLALAPIIVTSPTERCGTTLVQRLLSATSNGFLYGEEVGLHINALTGFFVGLLQHFEKNGAALDADFQRALAGTLVDWRPGLMPPTDVMLRAWVETYYQIPMALSDYSRAVGRPVWGFKGPSYSRDTIKALLSMMPRAKVIYIFRNPFDVLKSAKARRFVVTDEDAVAFCSKWATNMNEVSALRQDARIMFLKYESLLEKPKNHIRLLEQFTGTENVNERIFDVKINTFVGEAADGHSPKQYIEPAVLTAADHAAVNAKAGPLIAQLYADLATTSAG
jgi:hypothetical protein